MTEFDPIKAAREILQGLNDVLKGLGHLERKAEEAMSVAENELNIVRKLRGYCQGEVERQQARIASMEAERQ